MTTPTDSSPSASPSDEVGLALIADFCAKVAQLSGDGELFRLAADFLPSVLHADRCSIALIRSGESHAEIFALSGSAAVGAVGQRLDVRHTTIPPAVETGVAVEVPDTREDPRCPMLAAKGFLTSICVPIKIGRESIGTLNVGRRRAGGFTDTERKTLGIVAAVISGQLSRRQEHQETRSALLTARNFNARLAIVNKLAWEVGRARTLDRVIDLALECIPAVVDADRSTVIFGSRASGPWKSKGVKIGGLSASATSSVIRRSLQQAEVVVVPDLTEEDGEIERTLTAAGLRCALCVPILHRNSRLGTIAVASRALGVYGEGEQQLLAQIAAICATAFENVRLNNELERRRVQAERENAQKSRFLASVNHDIRTPLNAIVGSSDLLRRTGLSKDQMDLVEIIDTGSRALCGVVGDVLQLSAIEAGRVQPRLRPFDLNTFLDEVLSIVEFSAEEKGLEVRRTDSNLPETLVSDPDRLRQILVNLLSNAIKFASSGHVELSTSFASLGREEGVFTFRVSDSGPGIQDSVRDDIFLPFFRVHPNADGSGLGLAIAREISNLLEGNLTLEETGPKGSTFRLDLEARILVDIPETEVPPADSTEPGRELSGLRVLLADDNPLNRATLQLLLKNLGIQKLAVAESGLEALEAARNDAFDIIFMDVRMPEMDGMEAAQRIRALPSSKSSQSRIIALTASALDSDRKRFIEVGMDEHLPKPVRLETLRAVLLGQPAGHST